MGTDQVGPLEGGLCRPHLAPLPLYEPYKGLIAIYRATHLVTTHLWVSLIKNLKPFKFWYLNEAPLLGYLDFLGPWRLGKWLNNGDDWGHYVADRRYEPN